MRGRTPWGLLGVAIAVALTGCGAVDPGRASDTAERFYEAASARDGAAACGLLGDQTRKQLEKDAGSPCAEAVLGLELDGERAIGVSAYLTAAKVDLDGGDSVFLEETDEGWRVSAAGCRPVPAEESPYECEVES